MPQATDAQMQIYSDERVRPRAEQLRAVLNVLRDDKIAITDVYDRAANGAPWTDDRTAVPTIADQQDMLTYNAFMSAFIDIIDGVGDDATNAASIRAQWPAFQSMTVQPLRVDI